MRTPLKQLTLDEWDARYEELRAGGMMEPCYGGPLRRHLEDGDTRLLNLKYDGSWAALRLWNFLLTEEERLRQARDSGHKLVGTMKDLGTVPVLAYAFDNCTAFYPDGAWWIPCVMELGAGLLDIADSLGVDDSFCPVRAMLGAFATEAHFPIPDFLTCSVGATCDDFSAIAQRLQGMGHPILWWEMPHRREPQAGEAAVLLPGGIAAPAEQVELVLSELRRILDALQSLAGRALTEDDLRAGIRSTNRVRASLGRLRSLVYRAVPCPMPALVMLIAEMLAIHFCSDREESLAVLEALRREAETRIAAKRGYFGPDAARVFWVNPVADLRAMNLLEECGGRICGTDYLFTHALDPIPEDVPPLEALARTALADPMVGSVAQRAERICDDIRLFGAEAMLVSRIPGASHCALEGRIICDIVREKVGVPSLEIEVPPVIDALRPTLKTRLEALVESVKGSR